MIHLFNTLFCKKTKGVTFACHEDTLCIVVCGGPRPTDERGGGGACQKIFDQVHWLDLFLTVLSSNS